MLPAIGERRDKLYFVRLLSSRLNEDHISVAPTEEKKYPAFGLLNQVTRSYNLDKYGKQTIDIQVTHVVYVDRIPSDLNSTWQIEAYGQRYKVVSVPRYSERRRGGGRIYLTLLGEAGLPSSSNF